MPCNSDYLEPTRKEEMLQETAQLIVYVDDKMNINAPAWVYRQAKNCYATDIRLVPLLCKILDNLWRINPEDFETVVYNAKCPTSRKLADWYEKHKIADEQRIQREKEIQETDRIKKHALNKLTPKEKEILGLD